MSDLSEKALKSALQDAKAKGLPDGWTVKLDVRMNLFLETLNAPRASLVSHSLSNFTETPTPQMDISYWKEL